MRIDDLNQSTVARQNARIAAVERQAPLGNTSITTGRLRVVGLEAFLLQGTGRVTGTLYVDGDGAGGTGGRVDVSGSVSGDGTIDWDGPIKVKGTMHAYDGGKLVVSEAGDTSQSMQVQHDQGKGFVVGFGIPVEVRAWDSRLELNDGDLLLAAASGSVRIDSNAVRVERDGGYFYIDANEIKGARGDASFKVSEAEIDLKRGDTRFVMSGDDINLTVEGGARILVNGPKIVLKPPSGPSIELRDGNLYLNDLPPG